MFWATVVVIGRILVEPGLPPPDVHDPALLLIKRRDVVVGCTSGDAGVGGDAASDAVAADAGLDGGPSDAGIADASIGDAGTGDAGTGDAGMPDAGTCTMIPGDAVTMIVQPHISTSNDGTRFAVLLVTPARPIVELQGPIFDELATRTAPLIQTEIVEIKDPVYGTVCEEPEPVACGGGGGGCGGDWGNGGDWWDPPGIGDAGLGDGGLVEEMIGPYQFVRAQPTSSAELAGWLDQLGYAYMQADLDAVAPYIDLGFHVVAIRVAIDRPLSENLTPIALTWPGNALRVPAALGHATGVGPGRLTVYIAAEQKYVMPGAKVPYAQQTSISGMTFLTRNEIMLDQSKPVSADPIAVHLDNLPEREVKVVVEEVRVPVEVPCDREPDQDRGCCGDCNAKPRNRVDLLLIVGAVAFVLRRRRR